MRGTIFNKILTYAKYSSILRRKPEGIDLISPIQLFGNWTDGYALDLHTEPIKERHYTMGNAGHDSSVRTELADALYWYKYGSRRRFLAVISRTAASFIIEKQAQWMIDVIVAVPSSSTQRRF